MYDSKRIACFEGLSSRVLLTVDLGLDVTVDRTQYSAGQAVALDVVLQNQGGVTAQDVQVSTDILEYLNDVRWSVRASFPRELDTSDLHGDFGSRHRGEEFFGEFASSVAMGDANSDGRADVLVNNGGQGATVFLGREGFESLDQSEIDGSTGFSVPSASIRLTDTHDVNGDGLEDLLVTACCNARFDAAVIFGTDSQEPQGSRLDIGRLPDERLMKLTSGDSVSGFPTPFVGIGDVNADGLGDIAFAVRTQEARRTYVLFGSTEHKEVVDLSSLTASQGFEITGISVDTIFDIDAAGDLNNDGIADIAIGAPPTGVDTLGSAYVVFGAHRLGQGGSLDVNSLNGSNGFNIFNDVAPNTLGQTVSGVGDVNGDGVDDLLIGDSTYAMQTTPGAAYILFGRDGIGSRGTLDVIDSDDVTILRDDGPTGTGDFAISTDSAGDFNDDGINDILIGSPIGAGFNGGAYVIFGGPHLPDIEEPLAEFVDGSNGFRVVNSARSELLMGDEIGRSVAGGHDINGDGIDDVVVAAPLAGGGSGEVYVIYGRSGDAGSGAAIPSLEVPPESSRHISLVGFVPEDTIDTEFTIAVTAATSFEQPDSNPANNNALTDIAVTDLLPGDIDGDGAVTIDDFLILAEAFATTGADRFDGDFDGDNDVDFLDFLVLARNFGRTNATR